MLLGRILRPEKFEEMWHTGHATFFRVFPATSGVNKTNAVLGESNTQCRKQA